MTAKKLSGNLVIDCPAITMMYPDINQPPSMLSTIEETIKAKITHSQKIIHSAILNVLKPIRYLDKVGGLMFQLQALGYEIKASSREMHAPCFA